jgi:glycine C-acetyltransferase
LQNFLGKVDIVMGSFSKTFASNGGFVASNHSALKLALRYNCGPHTFTNAISPVQIAVISAALEIVRSDEGAALRRKLMDNILYLRERMGSARFEVAGQPSAIVPIVLGNSAFSRLCTRELLASGAVVNLIEYPAIPKNQFRWRLQMMAKHTFEQIDRFVSLATRAREAALPSEIEKTNGQMCGSGCLTRK